MDAANFSSEIIRFATYEVHPRAGEIRKAGVKLRLSEQPFQLLLALLERPGEVLTREELQKRLWPDTFVDVDGSLNAAINKIREILGDSAENPRFVETVPRRGYRFIGPTDTLRATTGGSDPVPRTKRSHTWLVSVLVVTCVLLAGVALFVYRRRPVTAPHVQRVLTRLTFDDGLQIGATWSPDSRYLAYSSDRGGKFDIWVQQMSGGDAVQITKGPGHHWQPDWSPDGKFIAYRSEDGGGGLYIIPALGGAGQERRISPFGYYPRWSPDSLEVLFQTEQLASSNRFYVVGLDGVAPHEVLADLAVGPMGPVSAAWHPDGKRISVWAWDTVPTTIPRLWTGLKTGGTAVRAEVSPELMKQMGEQLASREWVDWIMDFRFAWAPSGKAIYFERTIRGARNVWRLGVDPDTLRAVSIERLTTGPGMDTEPSLSPDGKRVAFTGESRQIRVWSFPFDAVHGRVTGTGQPVTLAGVDAWIHNLSRDGARLNYCGNRAGVWELREALLPSGPDTPLFGNDGYSRYFPQWSPDGKYLVYTREKPATGEGQLVIWSGESRTEDPITTFGNLYRDAYDWSLDGKQLLVSQADLDANAAGIWLLPIAAKPHAETAGRRIVSKPGVGLFESHFSPDGRWIVFDAVTDDRGGQKSTLYVTTTSGGPWIQITDGESWDDKPRWSPDGRLIYFVSGRGGFFNVWGVGFDAAKGKPVGKPFAVTSFKSPSLMVPTNIPMVELSFAQDRLTLTLEQGAGSLWVLDNVDQ